MKIIKKLEKLQREMGKEEIDKEILKQGRLIFNVIYSKIEENLNKAAQRGDEADLFSLIEIYAETCIDFLKQLVSLATGRLIYIIQEGSGDKKTPLQKDHKNQTLSESFFNRILDELNLHKDRILISEEVACGDFTGFAKKIARIKEQKPEASDALDEYFSLTKKLLKEED